MIIREVYADSELVGLEFSIRNAIYHILGSNWNGKGLQKGELIVDMRPNSFIEIEKTTKIIYTDNTGFTTG